MKQLLIKLNAQAPIYPEELFISRPCDVDSSVCDYCDAQYRCQFQFQNGETCPIVAHRHVWMRLHITAENILKLREM